MSESKKSSLSKPGVMLVLAVLCCLLWGSAFPVIKIGYRLFAVSSANTAAQILFAGIRFTLAGALVIIFGSAISKKPLVLRGKSQIGHCFILCAFQTVMQYTLFYIGLAHTSGVKASVLDSLSVFLSLIISTLAFKMEKLTAAKIIGAAVGFAGVVLINFQSGGFGGFSLNGDGAIILSALAYSISGVLIKRFSQTDNPVALSGWQFLAGGIIMSAFAFALGGRIHMQAGVKSFLILLYLALVSAVAYTVWGLLLKHNPVSRVAVTGFMNPVFGVLLSALVLGETDEAFNLKSLASLLLVCIGIYAVNANFKRGDSKKKLADLNK